MHTIKYRGYFEGRGELFYQHNPKVNEPNEVFVPRVGDTIVFPDDGLNPQIRQSYFGDNVEFGHHIVGRVEQVVIALPKERDGGGYVGHPSLHIEVF